MEAIASEAASGTNSAREAARRLGLPPSSVRNILRRILQLYPYKLQSCHELLPADTAQKETFAKWAFSKMEQDSTWVFNILWTYEAHFSFHGDVNNHNCPIWATSNPREYTQKPLHSPKGTAWCGFTGSFIIGPFFETQCPVNGWITEAVNAQRYLTLLRETVVPCLIQRGQIANVTFMQDGATSHTANPVKAFLIQTFGEDRIVSRRWRYPWPPRFPDLAPKTSGSHYEQLSEFERGRIIGLREAGWANRRIARHMGRSDAATGRCWQEWMDSGRFQRHDGSG
ncbi:DUF4817 domain-containing protein [Trichonephila clavipes]|uniref:DUF4817 domain-containing protein n=1 Tax=Trichonephila clavipes TaxID=2585209 RepID=A0A8X7BL33_TRICX|nr:DUF4817 domain-containing protein [Trichonephila clavipes]